MKNMILGLLAVIFLGCRNQEAISVQRKKREPYLHESVAGKKRDELIMGQLRASRLRVDSAANGGGACQYGTLLGAAQDFAGLNLTPEEMDYLKAEFEKPGPSGRPVVNFSNFLVIESEEVIAAALLLLIGREFQVTIRDAREMTRAERRRAQYTMRITRGHRNLGDPKGNYLWEPLEYSLETSIKKGKPEGLRYITISPRY